MPRLGTVAVAIGMASSFSLGAGAQSRQGADREGDRAVERGPAESEWELGAPSRVDVGLGIGLGHRLDQPPLYQQTERNGLWIGGGADVFLAERLSLGLAFEHLDLGEEQSGITRFGQLTLERDLNSVWLGFRLYPLVEGPIGAYLRLRLGLTWQSADASGVAWSPVDVAMPTAFRCEGNAGANVSFGAEIGADAAPTEALHLLGALGADGHRLSDGVMDDCAPGAGTAMVFGFRTGIAWAIDVR